MRACKKYHLKMLDWGVAPLPLPAVSLAMTTISQSTMLILPQAPMSILLILHTLTHVMLHIKFIQESLTGRNCAPLVSLTIGKIYFKMFSMSYSRINI